MAEHDQDISRGAEGGDGADAPQGRRGQPEGAPEAGGDGRDVPAERSAAGKLLRFLLLAIAWVAGGVAVLLLLFMLTLQTNWGGTHFADFLFTIGNPFAESETEYDELRGNFVTWLEFDDLRMYRLDTVYVDTVRTTTPQTIRYVPKDSLRYPGEEAAFDTLVVDTLMLAAIDTFRIRYNLLSLLRRQVHFREITFANPALRARQRPDSTWDLLEPFGADTSEAQPGRARFTFRIDDARITDGELLATYYPQRGDSAFQVENFNLEAREMLFEDLMSATVDTLYGRYSPRGQDYFTDLRLGGVLDENDVDLAGLLIESPASYLTAAGRFSLPREDEEEIEDIDFDLEADPIAFQDLQPFVPGINASESAVLDLHLGGSTEILDVDASASLSDGGSFSVVGSISPTTVGPVQYNGVGQLRSFDPSFFAGAGSRQTVLNADFDIALSGFDLQALDGTASASLTGSRLGGLELAGASFDALFDGGRADLDLTTVWNGSTVTAEGTARPFDDVPTYDLQGRTVNFNLASIGFEEQQSDVDATFTLEGSGFDMQTADIQGSIAMGPSTVNEYAINDGDVRFALAGGELDYGFRFLFPDGLLAANGIAQLEDPLRFTVQRGRFENVDLAALLGEPGPSSLNGTFRAEGVGSDPQAMAAEAILNMEPSQYGRFQLQDGSVQVTLENGLLQMQAVADMADAGRFNFAAVTRPFEDVPTFNVTRGQFTNVDIGVLLDQPGQSSDLSGTATFTVRGFDAETMQLDGRFDLAPSRINEQEITAAAADVQLRQGLLSFDGRIDVPDGSADLAGNFRPFQDVPSYEVTRGEFQNINLAGFTGNPELQSSLNGTLSISGRGFDPETMTVQGRVDFASSRLNEQQIDAASVVGNLEAGTFDVQLTLSVPEGDTRLAGTIQPFEEVPTYDVREGTFAGINIAALTGDPEWQTNLAGELSLTGRGFDPETMEVQGTVRFDPSVVNDANLTSGTIAGSLSNGLAQVDADLVFEEGAADVEGSGRFFQDVPTYTLAGTVSNVNVADIVGNDTLQARFSASFDLEGTGTDPETMTLQGRVVSEDAAYRGADVDTLHAQFQLAGGVLEVDSLFLRSTAADLEGSGVIAAYDTTTASDFRFTADIYDLSPFRDLLAAQNVQLEEGRLAGRVYGRPGTLRFDAQGRLRSFIYEDVRISEFEGTLAGEIGRDREITIAEIEGDFTAVALPQFFVQTADVDITYTPEGIRFDGTFQLEEGRSGVVAGFVETAPDVQRIVLEELTLDLDTQQWELLQEATIAYGEEYRVRNLLLFSGDQQIAVDGVIDPDGEQNLVMTLEGVDIAPFADILGYEGLGAIVDGTLLLTGPAEAPEMTGTLNAEVSSNQEDVGDLELALDYEDLRLNIDALLTHEDGSTLDAVGYIPLDLRVARLSEGGVEGGLVDRTVDFTITADSFGVGWVEPFLDPDAVNQFTGRLTANVDVSGAIDDPVLDGNARYIDGRIGLPELGLVYGPIRADLVLERNEVAVNDFIIESGNGNLRGSGTILLPQLTLGEFNVDLRADEFLAVDSREYRFVVNGDMVLSGTTSLPEIQGNVDVVSGEIMLTEETTSPELEQIELTDQDLQTVERRFGIHVTAQDTTTFDLYNALAMELDVSIERNTWIRSEVNPVMDIQFSGDLDLMKEHYEDVNIFGTIEVVPQRSRIVQFGRRFEIASGTLTFNGPPGDPLIDIEAEHQPRPLGRTAGEEEVTITLSLEGRLSERLDLTLGSDPQMTNADILSFLATGQPARSGLGGEEVLQGLALPQLTMLMEGIAEAGLGLDVVTIEQRAGTPHLTAGSYVSSRLFVSVSQPLGDPSGPATSRVRDNVPIITAEYEVANWLLLQLMQHGEALHLNLQWEYAY